jgi:hypothetical protein
MEDDLCYTLASTMLVIKKLAKAKQVQPPINGSLMSNFFHTLTVTLIVMKKLAFSYAGIVVLRNCTSEARLLYKKFAILF